MSKTLICDYCHKAYTASRLNKSGNHFCSTACRVQYHDKQKRDYQCGQALHIIGEETGLYEQAHKLRILDASAIIQAVKLLGYSWQKNQWVKTGSTPDNDPSRYDKSLFDDIPEPIADNPDEQPSEYNLIYSVSRSSANNSTATHVKIDNDKNLQIALCGYQPRGNTWVEAPAGEPTCKTCRRLLGLED